MIEILVRDLRVLIAALLGASTKKQVEILRDMTSRTHRVANHLNADLALERRLKEAR